MKPIGKEDSRSTRATTESKNIWTKRRHFWDGFFSGFFSSFDSTSLRSELSDILDNKNSFAEDQQRIGRDMRIAMNIVSEELENSHR